MSRSNTVRRPRRPGSHDCERFGNFRRIYSSILPHVRAAARSEYTPGAVSQNHARKIPEETPGVSAIAAGAGAGQLCGGDSNRTLRDDPQARKIGFHGAAGDYEAAVDDFIRTKGVTRCPTACLVRTQASVPAADRAALERYEAGREQSRRHHIAATARLLGVVVPPPDPR